MQEYIFNGGTVKNRYIGKICIIGWIFETDPNYCICYFKDGGLEICRLDNLIPIKD